MRRRELLLGAAAGLTAPAIGLHAESAWPSQPLRLVVPFPPGAANDTLGRAIADQLSPRLGQPVIVENRAGAGGAVGAETVARAAPDGYTLLLGHIGTLAVNPAIYPNLPYDVMRDFAPVAMIAKVPNVLVVHPKLPFQDVKSFVEYVRAHPNQLRFCSAGNGSAGHIVMLAFLNALGLEMEHVPYRGLGPALTDLIAGRVDVTLGGVPTVMPFVQQGQLRALAVSSAERVASLPEVPTVAETVSPGFDVVPWYGIAAPAATPQAVILRINQEVNASLNSPAVKQRLEQEGAVPAPMTPEQFAALIRSELGRWAKLIHEAGVTAN